MKYQVREADALHTKCNKERRVFCVQQTMNDELNALVNLSRPSITLSALVEGPGGKRYRF